MSSAITISAVGAGMSAYNGMQANKNASKALSAQQAAQQADLDFRQKQYDRYLGLMGPIEEQQSRDAQSSQPLDYDQNAAAIKTNFAAAGRANTSAMGMRGMAGSGTDLGMMRGLAMGEAGAKTGAYATGLQNRRNLGLALTNKNQIQNAAGQLSGGMQNMSNLFGGQANMYNQAAMGAGQAFTQGLGNLGSAIKKLYDQPPPPAQPGGDGYGSPSFDTGTGNYGDAGYDANW